MSFITGQQAKLDLELVLKKKRVEIKKCNGRLNLGKIQKEPTFQVVLDAFTITPCYFAFLIIADVLKGQEFNALPTNEEIMSFLRDLGHTRRSIHLMMLSLIICINLGGLLLLPLTKVYLERQLKAQKFKKPVSPKLTTVLVLTEAPTRKSKRVKRPAKKSTETPARGVVIRETPEMPLFKKKKKMIVEKRKRINLLFEVALTKEAQFEEVRKKSIREFYKTHPSGFGTVTKTAPNVAKIKPSATSEGTEDDDDDEDEIKITDKAEGDEDKEMDYTPSQLYDDVDIRLNEPVDTDKRVTALEKEVAELKKDDPLKTQVTAHVNEHLDARLGATRDEFMNFLSTSITARITEQVKNQLPQIMPKEVFNFAPRVIQSMVTESLEQAVLDKESSQPQYSYEAATTLTEFE
uniref:Uncharacterized protein n=1 Tax=Tanacetum cinerariifolium TaxID=118510 RepID=A0A6L2KI33_TANCI|nr:hypothetical protein [Tanacetum cinerariifolium]